MAKLIEFAYEGGSVCVEVVDSRDQEESRVGRTVVESATRTFEQVLDEIRPVAHAVATRLRSAVDSPDELSVEFGFRLTAEAGAIIARTASEGHFQISLTWKTHSE